MVTGKKPARSMHLHAGTKPSRLVSTMFVIIATTNEHQLGQYHHLGLSRMNSRRVNESQTLDGLLLAREKICSACPYSSVLWRQVATMLAVHIQRVNHLGVYDDWLYLSLSKHHIPQHFLGLVPGIVMIPATGPEAFPPRVL